MDNIELIKLSYEIKTRKREFLGFCSRMDIQLMTKLSLNDMADVLDNFTCFLKRDEKDSIIKKFSTNNSFVNYMNIANFTYNWKVEHKDEFLLFLNRLRERPELQYLNINAKRLSSVINLSPLENLDYQMSEENFVKKICKQILDNCEDFDNSFEICDFDRDNSFTIGEMALFFEKIGIDIWFDDMIFFFESLNPNNGRIEKETLRTQISSMAKGRYSKLELNRDLNDIVSKEEEKELETIKLELERNKFIGIIKESINALGKISLMRYMAKFFELFEGKLLIELTYLEKAYVQLGFGTISQLEINNFKFIVIRNKIANRFGKRLLIDIEALFEYIIEYFKLLKNIEPKNSNQIMNDINGVIFKELSVKLKGLIFPHNTSDDSFPSYLPELDFRKRFYKRFGFMDHSFLDNFVDYTKDVGTVDIDKWTHYSFNILFMGFIKYYDQLGLMLDLDDRSALNIIYKKIEEQAFPKDMQVKEKIIKLSETQKMVLRDDGENIKLNIAQTAIPLLTFKDKVRLSDKKEIIIKKEEKKENKKEFNPNDTVNHIPKLYNICVNYLLEKFKLENINMNLISNLGICRIFRDHFNSKQINIHRDIEFDLFSNTLEDILPEDIMDFIKHYSGRYKNGFNEINVQFFFSNIEAILLQYSKINNVS